MFETIELAKTGDSPDGKSLWDWIGLTNDEPIFIVLASGGRGTLPPDRFITTSTELFMRFSRMLQKSIHIQSVDVLTRELGVTGGYRLRRLYQLWQHLEHLHQEHYVMFDGSTMDRLEYPPWDSENWELAWQSMDMQTTK